MVLYFLCKYILYFYFLQVTTYPPYMEYLQSLYFMLCLYAGPCTMYLIYLYVQKMLIFYGNKHGNNWQYLLNVGIWIKCIATTYRRSNTKTCFGRSTKGGSRREGVHGVRTPFSWGADPPPRLFSIGLPLSLRLYKNSPTHSLWQI